MGPLLMSGAAGAIAVAVAAGAAWHLRGLSADAEIARLQLEQQEAVNEQFWTQRRRAEGVDRDVQRRLRAADAAAAGARSELEQLRAVLEVGDAGVPAVCAGIAERAATTRRLFGECSGRYEEVARDAQRYAEQLLGWQALTPGEEAPVPDE